MLIPDDSSQLRARSSQKTTAYTSKLILVYECNDMSDFQWAIEMHETNDMTNIYDTLKIRFEGMR